MDTLQVFGLWFCLFALVAVGLLLLMATITMGKIFDRDIKTLRKQEDSKISKVKE